MGPELGQMRPSKADGKGTQIARFGTGKWQ